jgi:RHS repeat-associated protein
LPCPCQTPHSEPTLYTQYRYDTAGQRVLKIVRKHGDQLAVTTYIGGVFERLTLTSAAGTSSYDELHILDGATRVATAQASPPPPGDASPRIAYHLGDHLGSSTVTLDGTGALFNREEYTPYGETSFGGYAKKRYRHTAKERDEESGLYYHSARYYAPWLGRWNSPDPAGLRDGLNQYCYVHGNPLKNSDPTGLQTIDAGTPPQPQVTGVSGGTPDAERQATYSQFVRDPVGGTNQVELRESNQVFSATFT